MRPVQIAPSVLPVDFSKLGEAITALDAAGVDLIQWDVMDGQFVPNLTFGPDVIASTRHLTKKPFEAHLMVLTPDVMAKRYVEAGCQRLIVHAEACDHLHRTLGNIRELGATAAVALNPGVIHTDMLASCFAESASEYPTPEEWIKTAGPFILKISPRDNGRPLTVPC